MNLPRNIQLAIGFLFVLLVIVGGVWAYRSFFPASATVTPGASSTGIFGSLFPFGSGATQQSPSITAPQNNGGGVAPDVRHITTEKVAGATFAMSNNAEVVRYVERETGRVFETPVKDLTITRLTNTTIPAVSLASWVTASSTIYKFLSDDGTPENFLAHFASSTPDQSLQGTFLQKFNRVALSSVQMVTVTESASGSVVQTVPLNGGAPKTLLASQIRSWVPLAGGNTAFVASAPSSGVLGAVYSISAGSLQKVVGGISGLLASVSPSGRYILVSGSTESSVAMGMYDRETSTLTPLPRATFATKCAWVPNNEPVVLCAIPNQFPIATYPDDWLLGRVHTADQLWFINATTVTATVASDFSTADGAGNIDITDMRVNTDGTRAIFIDRNDSTLWETTLIPR